MAGFIAAAFKFYLLLRDSPQGKENKTLFIARYENFFSEWSSYMHAWIWKEEKFSLFKLSKYDSKVELIC